MVIFSIESVSHFIYISIFVSNDYRSDLGIVDDKRNNERLDYYFTQCLSN